VAFIKKKALFNVLAPVSYQFKDAVYLSEKLDIDVNNVISVNLSISIKDLEVP